MMMRCCDHLTLAWMVFACCLSAIPALAVDPETTLLNPGIHKIPVSPLHGIKADGEILAATHSLVLLIGDDYDSQQHYLTSIKLPTGEVLDQVTIASPLEGELIAAASREGSRVAIVADDAVQIRNTEKLDQVANLIPVEIEDIVSLALSHDGEQIALGSNGSITLYNCQTGETLHQVSIESERPSVFYSDLNQLYAYDPINVWFVDHQGRDPEVIMTTPEGLQLEKAVISNEHCYAILKKLQTENALKALFSGSYFNEPHFIAKYDLLGDLKWQIKASSEAMAVSEDTVAYIEKNMLMRTNDAAKPVTVGRCERLRQVSFTAGGEFLVGVVNANSGIQVWDTQTWQPHDANALPYGSSASAIDDNGRATVTSQSSVCVADRGEPFHRSTDLPEDLSPYLGERALSGDGTLLAWITQSKGVKLKNLVSNQEITMETRGDHKAKSVWLNGPGNRAIIQYKNSESSPSRAAQQGLVEGFFGSAYQKDAVPTDLIELPSGKRIGEFDSSDLEILVPPTFPSDKILYSTIRGIAHFVVKPDGVRRTGTLYNPHMSHAVSMNGTIVVGAKSGKVLLYQSPTSPPRTLMTTTERNSPIVKISPDGQTVYCCEYDDDRRQTLLKVIDSSDASIRWEQWLPGDTKKLDISPQGKYLLLTMKGEWYVVHVES